MQAVFFDNWFVLLRTLIVGVLAYAVLVVLLRAAGNRTLSKMNAFDLVVTVALGSTLATVLLSKETALAQGILGFALLIGLQFLITWSSVRVKWIRQAVTGEPALLCYHGRALPAAQRRARVTDDELLAAARSSGLATIDATAAIILETDGSFTVIPKNESDALPGVKKPSD
jgi:uncharacterized membrane protein YcaP (DUF421 family)